MYSLTLASAEPSLYPPRRVSPPNMLRRWSAASPSSAWFCPYPKSQVNKPVCATMSWLTHQQMGPVGWPPRADDDWFPERRRVHGDLARLYFAVLEEIEQHDASDEDAQPDAVDGREALAEEGDRSHYCVSMRDI